MNTGTEIFKADTEKSPDKFIEDLCALAKKSGFVVRDVHDMNQIFKGYGVDVSNDFRYYMVQMCNPKKAYNSISANPERGVLIPKFVVVFRKDEKSKTEVRFLSYSEAFVGSMFGEDSDFQKSLPDSCRSIINIINEALKN
ncbi:conserved hypothetical protein [groundwater metagenome]|uniref:DUF302 domain-containing protein n=1 Tax=groundwater metagenome TaxID=717931 RepID=A0A098EBF6_9ZZZZ